MVVGVNLFSKFQMLCHLLASHEGFSSKWRNPKFSCCSKSGNKPQHDLAKSGYKTNRKSRNPITNHQFLLAKFGDFKKKEARNLPKSSKNLGNFITFFLRKCDDFLGNFPQSSFNHVSQDFCFQQIGKTLPKTK